LRSRLAAGLEPDRRVPVRATLATLRRPYLVDRSVQGAGLRLRDRQQQPDPGGPRAARPGDRAPVRVLALLRYAERPLSSTAVVASSVRQEVAGARGVAAFPGVGADHHHGLAVTAAIDADGVLRALDPVDPWALQRRLHHLLGEHGTVRLGAVHLE